MKTLSESKGADTSGNILAPIIEEFIDAKRSEGKKFKREATALRSFGRYCQGRQIARIEEITPELIDDWHHARPTLPQAKDYRYLARQLCIHLKTTRGCSVTIPSTRLRRGYPAPYQFESVFASLLNAFVEDKRASGYKYESERKILRYFDLLCLQRNESELFLNKDLIRQWMVQRSTESIGYRNKRVSLIRQFSIFLASRGLEVTSIPQTKRHVAEKPHIFHQEEVASFFQNLDRQDFVSPYMQLTVPTIFRFYYCLGLRLNEAVNLERKDIDLKSGKVTLRMAKCLKDRILIMPDDLRELAFLYDTKIRQSVLERTFFFVSDVLGTKVHDTGLCRIFNRCWKETAYASFSDKKPTIHSFRHTLVVRKLEEWFEKNLDYEYWLPYLSAHLGHTRLEETYCYVHLVDSAFPQIRHSMSTFERLYPEVNHEQAN